VHHHWKSAGGYSTVGLELALSVIFGLFAGQWLDEKFSGTGWFTVIGFCFGLAAGGRAVYRALQQANREADREAEEAQKERQDYLDEKDHRREHH
jgi:F0F1-type ATP synthase assembly protein I